ncbi:hypothetical protein [Psychrobacillus psychrotolerans]|nr:hypothetical protein [Psychrobacillus psychrotolerans]
MECLETKRLLKVGFNPQFFTTGLIVLTFDRLRKFNLPLTPKF